MKDVLTLQEVASYLKVHPNTVYRLARKGRIPAFKIGSDWRFRKQALERWLDDSRGARESSSPSDDVFHVTFWLASHGIALTTTSREVAKVLDLSRRAAEREMRALASRGLLSEREGAFALTPEGLEVAKRHFAQGRGAPAGHASVVAFASRQLRSR